MVAASGRSLPRNAWSKQPPRRSASVGVAARGPRRRNPGSALAPGGAVDQGQRQGFVTDTTMAEVKS